MSDHFLYGFLINDLPSFEGTSSATANANWALVTLNPATFESWAIAIPSKPINASDTFSTPLSWHCCNSLSLILLDAFAISGVSIPNPAQNNFNPPPVPVDSTTGVGNFPPFPNSSATEDEKG